MGQPFFVPCSTVLLLGGSCGSCLTLRVDEDVTEEERDPPLWRCPLTQNNMTESRKQKGEGKGRHGGEKKCEYKGRMKSVKMGRRENDIKVITFAVESAIRWWNLTSSRHPIHTVNKMLTSTRHWMNLLHFHIS